MFTPVDPRQSFPELEKSILQYWREEGTFQRSIEQRKDAPVFSFYDGPPFATGLPHYGHLLAGTIKDVIPRYQTMRGKNVQRRFGWDCHGLPIENLIEKEHNITSKTQIEEMGIATFNGLCRSAVQRYTKEWRTIVERMGRWVDMDWDYRTMDSDFMESIWWVFSSLWDKGLIYEGHKPMHICPRCVTPLSNFEVSLGYSDRTDMTTIATFPLRDDPKTVLLAWTTTTWSLPGDLWLGLGARIPYVRVRRKDDDRTYILAEKRVSEVFKDYAHEILGPIDVQDLVGKKYLPLFDYYVDTVMPSTAHSPKPVKFGEKCFTIILHPEVAENEGTGIVHFANTNAEDGFLISKDLGVDLVHYFGIDGKFYPEVRDFAGMEIKPSQGDPMATDLFIIHRLKEMGRLFTSHTYKHSYPHCWRCDSPLINYATSSWFIAVEKIKQHMLACNSQTSWVPEHIRDGRFGKWLENARDWAISRNRYWGTPLPIWRSPDNKETTVIGSRDALMERKKIRFTKVSILRHGEGSSANNSTLTAQGESEARRAGATLAKERITAIYTSPLACARETANIIAAATHAPIIIDERLSEKDIDKTPDRETSESVVARVHDFLREILPRHRSDHIVFVSHLSPILYARSFFTQEDILKLSRQPPPAFTVPESYFWDHQLERSMDLHKDAMDSVFWPSSDTSIGVDVTLVRHGQTTLNSQGLIQGSNVDPPLNAEGRRQAVALADTLKSEAFDLILSSDLTRAVETAEIISKRLGIPFVERWDILRERNAGTWSGRNKEDILHDCPTFHPVMNPSLLDHTPPDGESLSHILARAEEAYEKLLATYTGKRILIVSHNGFIQALRSTADNMAYADAVTSTLQNGELCHLKLRPLVRRIPEVLDCWFESGSMPYAQAHFPFRAQNWGDVSSLPPGFPADFIAEGIDQTRGWFYTLTVLAAGLFTKPAFQHCIVNGIILAEDGHKMSKRLKNYPEPTVVMEQYGADAMRFMLMNSPAVRAEDVRFSEHAVSETLRSVILPLWNCYSFFVTYANAVEFTPSPHLSQSSHPLDRWILAEVQDLCNRMTRQLDAYDLSATCSELHETIDALTNWYIRLSRRRFAGKGNYDESQAMMKDDNESDQQSALQTLHGVLVRIAQLLAPFCPFVTEAIYQNLVPTHHGSIHLTNWPACEELSSDARLLLEKNRLLRRIVSLGHRIRSERMIKTRQPLASVTVLLPPSIPSAVTQAMTDDDFALLQEELNVESFSFSSDTSGLETVIRIDARMVGPRLGGRVQEVIRAGKEGRLTIADDGRIRYGDDITLEPEEFSVLYKTSESEGIAADHGVVVRMDTVITPRLHLAGQARDLIRLVQRLRKASGCAITDSILLSIDGSPELLASHGTLLCRETKATLTSLQEWIAEESIDIDGHVFTVRMQKTP